MHAAEFNEGPEVRLFLAGLFITDNLIFNSLFQSSFTQKTSVAIVYDPFVVTSLLRVISVHGSQIFSQRVNIRRVHAQRRNFEFSR